MRSAFDPNNNYLYALSSTSDLLRIDANGVISPLGVVPGLPNGINVGAFDQSGDYWVTESLTSTAYEIGGTSMTPTVTATRSLVSPTGAATTFLPADWTWSSGGSGYFWGLSGRTIYRVDVNLGVVSPFPVPSNFPTTANATFGAAWTYGNGNLGFSITRVA